MALHAPQGGDHFSQVVPARRDGTSKRAGAFLYGNRARKTALGSVIGTTSGSRLAKYPAQAFCGGKLVMEMDLLGVIL